MSNFDNFLAGINIVLLYNFIAIMLTKNPEITPVKYTN